MPGGEIGYLDCDTDSGEYMVINQEGDNVGCSTKDDFQKWKTDNEYYDCDPENAESSEVLQYSGPGVAGFLCVCSSDDDNDRDCLCGNGICEPEYGEGVESCSVDCICKIDAFCDTSGGENYDNCPDDCICGNGLCDIGEDYGNCYEDCNTCGNDICDLEFGETPGNCGRDCNTCGNDICDTNLAENSRNCPEDCISCGNGICDPEFGEDSVSCSLDCFCNNDAFCDYGENRENCPRDCPCNDNGICENNHGLENEMNCPRDCTLNCRGSEDPQSSCWEVGGRTDCRIGRGDSSRYISTGDCSGLGTDVDCAPNVPVGFCITNDKTNGIDKECCVAREYCGDGICQSTEDYNSCSRDCP
ncbi:MAG: hypothetical protein QF535_02410 [Anaerolineales bacterium]|nr:hypothetical protein [Anaerolineales bacterium]